MQPRCSGLSGYIFREIRAAARTNITGLIGRFHRTEAATSERQRLSFFPGRHQVVQRWLRLGAGEYPFYALWTMCWLLRGPSLFAAPLHGPSGQAPGALLPSRSFSIREKTWWMTETR